MDLKTLHFNLGTRRHKDVPYMWRSRCCCGMWFLAASEELAKAAIENHLSQEEPFPDLNLEPESRP